MQQIFHEVTSLDKRAYSAFHLSEELLMEHAALAMASEIKKRFCKGSSVLIVAGSGHNGADGVVLARLLAFEYDVKLYFASKPKSDLAKLQRLRTQSIGHFETETLQETDILVDALFGSGLNRTLEGEYLELIEKMNGHKGFKLSCDIPSGILSDGTLSSRLFRADVTVTMGALKLALFGDRAKDFVGEIVCAQLGLPQSAYETQANHFLLQEHDMKLPFRHKQNSHKGSYGHANILAGSMPGAAKMAALACYAFGAGLTTLISKEPLELPSALMQSRELSKNVTAIALGMGLQNSPIDWEALQSSQAALILDADILYEADIKKLLKAGTIITPHPKEFVALLKRLDIADISVETLQNERFKYAKMFSESFSEVVLLLKGANVIIAYKKQLYINTFGSAALAKGGSGDILSGLICALRAQGYEPLDAAISASLAHTLSIKKSPKHDFAIGAMDIIEGVGRL